MSSKSTSFSSSTDIENYVKSINWKNRLKNEIPFLDKLFRTNKYNKILDLGCGPGFHVLEFAKLNYAIYGLDSSYSMIDYAKQLCRDTPAKNNFLLGDFLTDPCELHGPWDAIFCLGNSLMIIWSQNNIIIQNIFSTLFNALHPNGGLFFQVLNSDCPRIGYVISDIFHNEQTYENQILVKHFLPIEKTLHTAFITLKWKDGETAIKKEESSPGKLQLVSLLELKNVLQHAGFNKFSFWENYKGDAFKIDSSDSLLCFAQKASY